MNRRQTTGVILMFMSLLYAMHINATLILEPGADLGAIYLKSALAALFGVVLLIIGADQS